MECGYFTLTDNPPSYGAERRDVNQFLREVIAEGVLAEELGFASVWLPEHHFGLFGCLPTPALYLAHLAAKTRRVKLAPGTVVLPINQPLRLAEELLGATEVSAVDQRMREKHGELDRLEGIVLSGCGFAVALEDADGRFELSDHCV